MRFPNPCGYYRVFGARDGSGFPTAIQRDSVAELVFFRSLLEQIGQIEIPMYGGFNPDSRGFGPPRLRVAWLACSA
jgi:hypothetical protein